MTYQEPLSQKAITISISESDEMASLGLAEEHLRDAMAEVARHLLAMGARLLYGGDLRAHGFTELLFELVARHRRDADINDPRPGVTNYLSWPVYAAQSSTALAALAEQLRGIAEIRYLDEEGREFTIETEASRPPQTTSNEEWALALTSMRRLLTRKSDARLVLGGRLHGYKGRMPGVAEEALLSLENRKPLFLMAGFGGCARDIARKLGFETRTSSEQTEWPALSMFRSFNRDALHNGLNREENATLVRTPHVDQAIALVLRGLLRLGSQ